MIEGLWNVPTGTEFQIQLADGYVVSATARWCKEDRMGVQFAQPLALDANGAVQFTPPRMARDGNERSLLRRSA